MQHPYSLRGAESVPLFHPPLISDCTANFSTAKRLRLALVGYSVDCSPYCSRYQRSTILFIVTVMDPITTNCSSLCQCRQCPTPSVGRTFHVRRRAARLSLGCKVTLLQPQAGGSAGSITLDLRPIDTRRYMQLVGYPVTRRGRLQMSPYCPRLRPWAGG